MQRTHNRELQTELQRVRMDHDDRVSRGDKESWVRRLNCWFYVRNLCWWRSLDETEKAAEAAGKAIGTKQEELQEKELEATGNAIIVFNDETSANNMVLEFENRLSSIGSTAVRFFSPHIVRAFHVATGALPPPALLPLGLCASSQEACA